MIHRVGISTAIFIVSLTLLLVGTAIADDVATSTPPPELAEAIAKLRDWRKSFSTLRVTYKWSNPGQLIVRMPELKDNESKLAGWYHLDEFVWSDRQLVRMTKQHFQGGQLAKRQITARNARLQFGAEYTGDARFPMELGAKLAGPGTEWNFEECQPLYKVHQYNNQWITDLFDRYAPIDVGIQEIKGSRCVGYRVIPDSPETLWFDLNHDGLVRKVEVSANVHADDWECTEFQQTNTGRWFPKRGTYRFANESEYQFEVVAVTMNEPFPASEFEPPPIDEQTIVVDRTGGLLGIQKKKKNTDSSTLTSNGTPPAVPKSPLIAVPSSKTWIWVLAVFLSVLCLIVGWRSRQQS